MNLIRTRVQCSLKCIWSAIFNAYFQMFEILKKISESLRLWGNKLMILKLIKATTFFSQKWFSNRAAKLPRDLMLWCHVGCRLHSNPCLFLLYYLITTRRLTLNSDSSLDIFSVLERVSLRHVECKQNLCNQHDVTIWIKLGPVFLIGKTAF